MHPTTSDQSSLPKLVLESSQSWDEITPQFRERVVAIALSFTLYGMFVPLWGASIYALGQKWLNNRKQPINTLILTLSLFALFSSTTTNMVVTFLGNTKFLFAAVYSPDSTSQFICSSCAPTAALTINILLGDAIVCWRACILWKGNRTVMSACVMLLLATFALGIVDTKYTCELSLGSSGPWNPDPHADGNGNLYEGFSYGVAATVLSLSTNLFATGAVMMRSWQSRRVLKRYVVTGPVVSQMQRVFALLVESGLVYCALWVVVLAWQAGIYKGVPSQSGDNSFWDIFTTIINGALVPLIAIYPTVIIVVVALSRAHIEDGPGSTSTSQSIERSVYRLPLRPLTIAVNTTVTTRCDSQPRGRSERVVAIGNEGSEPKDKDGPEGSSTHTAEDEKLEDMIV